MGTGNVGVPLFMLPKYDCRNCIMLESENKTLRARCEVLEKERDAALEQIGEFVFRLRHERWQYKEVSEELFKARLLMQDILKEWDNYHSIDYMPAICGKIRSLLFDGTGRYP